MVLPDSFVKGLRPSLLRLFREIQNNTYDPKDIEVLYQDTYFFYKKHRKNLVSKSLPEIRKMLSKIRERLEGIEGLHFQEGNGFWLRVYTFDPEDEAKIDECSVRYYLNPKVGRYMIILMIMIDYFKLEKSKQAPLMFKLPVANADLGKFLEGTEKIIMYLSPEKDLPVWFENLVSTYRDDWFYDFTPLFTHKVRKGVGKAFEPREENSIVRLVRGVLGEDDSFLLSYGMFMSYTIAQHVRTYFLRLGWRERFRIKDLDKDQKRELLEEVLRKLAKDCEKNLMHEI